MASIHHGPWNPEPEIHHGSYALMAFCIITSLFTAIGFIDVAIAALNWIGGML